MKKFLSIAMRIKFLFSILFIAIGFVGCNRSKYEMLVESEMAKPIVHDSIFFGHRFGQTRQEFFDICWELNKKGLVTQGPKNSFVQYDLPAPKESTKKIRILFYGIFDEKKIMTGMDIQFSYIAWSPWNSALQSDKLIEVVKDTLRSWYPGNDFIAIPSKKYESDILVKVDGNRRIIIEPLSDLKDVDVRIDDLRYKID